MRVSTKLSTVLKALVMEVAIIAFIGLVYFYQYRVAEDELVLKAKAIAETIGEQASSFFSSRSEKATSDEFFLFLDERLGRKKLFNTFDIAPKFFSVVLRKDIEKSGLLDRFSKDFFPSKGFNLENANGLLSVSIPFIARGDPLPYGIVKIDSDIADLRYNVLSENFLLYTAILLVLNNQAFILYLLMGSRRKREVIFEKGYLKEHSMGALKIFHRVLGDIIDDHEGQAQTVSDEKQGDGDGKVISLSELLEKRGR